MTVAVEQTSWLLWTARRKYRRVRWLGDVHVPYHDRAAIGAALKFGRDFRPDLVIVGGDLLDCHSISRYEKDPRRLGETVQKEIDGAASVIAAVDSLGADTILLTGNHDARIEALAVSVPGLAGLDALRLDSLLSLPPRWGVLPSQAWKRDDPEKLFAGLTQQAFADQVAEAQRTSRQLEALLSQVDHLRNQRSAQFKKIAALNLRLKSAIVADPDHGSDSTLFEAFGGIRVSERRSGLTRKHNDPTDDKTGT